MLVIGALAGLANALMIMRLQGEFLRGNAWNLDHLSVASPSGYSGGMVVTGVLPDAFCALAQKAPLGVEMPIWYVLAVAILLYILFEYTATGRHMRAVGGNRAAARSRQNLDRQGRDHRLPCRRRRGRFRRDRQRQPASARDSR